MDTCSKCNFKINPKSSRSKTNFCPIHEFICFVGNKDLFVDQFRCTFLEYLREIKKRYVIRSYRICLALGFLKSQFDIYIEGQTSCIDSIIITRDSKYAMTLSCTTIQIWNLELRRQVKSLETRHLNFGPSAINSDGSYIVYRYFPVGMMHLLDPISGRCESIISGHTGYIYDIVFTMDSNYIVTGSADKSVRIWSIAEGRPEAVLYGHTSRVNSVAVTYYNTFIISGSDDETIRVWSFSEKIQYFILYEKYPIYKVAMSRDNTFVVYTACFYSVKLWNIGENPILVNSDVANVFNITNDNKYIITALASGIIIFWNVQEQRIEKCLDSENRVSVKSMALSNDDKCLLCEYSDHSLVLWKIGAQSEGFVFDGHIRDVTTISITRDCRYVVSGSNDDTIRVWSTEDKKQKYVIKIYDTEILSVAVIDRYIVIGLLNGLVLVWRLLRN